MVHLQTAVIQLSVESAVKVCELPKKSEGVKGV